MKPSPADSAATNPFNADPLSPEFKARKELRSADDVT